MRNFQQGSGRNRMTPTSEEGEEKISNKKFEINGFHFFQRIGISDFKVVNMTLVT